MARFAFEAVDRTGVLVRGFIEAADERGVLDQLIAQGHTPVSLTPSRGEHAFVRRLRGALGLHSFDYVLFLRELATLLKAGLPVERALLSIHNLSTDSGIKLRTQQLLNRIRGGEPLSRAFAAVITEAPAHIGRLLSAGEASGQLAAVMGRLASGMARTRALKSRLVSDLTYPAILVVAMIVVLWVVFHTVLPRLAPVFSEAGVALPLATQMLMSVGAFFDGYGFLLLCVALTAAIICYYSLRQPHVRLRFDHQVLTNRATFGISRAFEAALLCRNLETMLDGGLPLERALAVASDGIANSWLRAQIQKVKQAVSEGHRLSQAFKLHAPDLPPITIEFAAVGEETGRLASMMAEAAELLDSMVQARLAKFTALVVPVTTLAMGGLVACLMAGIVSGILAVNDLAH